MPKFINRLAVSVTLELLFSIIFGWVTAYRIDGNAAFVSGILAFIGIELVRSSAATKSMEEKIDQLMTYTASFKKNDAFAEIRFLYLKRGTATVTEQSVEVDARGMLKLWRECISRAENSWAALQYAGPDDTWGLGWGQSSGHFIQEERMKSGCTIERLFLTDNDKDKARWEPIVTAQRAAGIKVGWVKKSSFLANKVTKEKLDFLHTSDIAVWDNRWAFLIYLNAKRDVVGARVTEDEDILDACRFLLAEASKSAENPNYPQQSIAPATKRPRARHAASDDATEFPSAPPDDAQPPTDS